MGSEILARLKPGFIPSDIKLVDQLKQLIEENFSDHREVDFYLQKLPISEYRLNKILLYHTGMTLYELIQERIHREACILLESTTMSVKEIAFELGWNDPSNFSKGFTRYAGISPSVFRQLKVLI